MTRLTAFCGLNIYDAGELSTMTILLGSRPNRFKSCKSHNCYVPLHKMTELSLM